MCLTLTYSLHHLRSHFFLKAFPDSSPPLGITWAPYVLTQHPIFSLPEHFHTVLYSPLYLSELCSRLAIFRHEWASESPVGLAKTQFAGSYPQSFWFSNCWGLRGASDLHLYQVPRWCWWYNPWLHIVNSSVEHNLWKQGFELFTLVYLASSLMPYLQ